jgi:hypothetical protein
MGFSEEFLEKIRKEEGYDSYLHWKRRGELTTEQYRAENYEKIRKERGYDAYLKEKASDEDLDRRIRLISYSSYSSYRRSEDDEPYRSSYSYSSDSGVDALTCLNIITSTF